MSNSHVIDHTNGVRCNNGTDVYYLSKQEYENLSAKYLNANVIETYKGVNYLIHYDKRGYFCGYVEGVPENIKYVPHGEFTGGYDETYNTGFDCSHCGDLYGKHVINISKRDSEASFKDIDFVRTECRNIIDSMLQHNE